jgi:hypothetical protein
MTTKSLYETDAYTWGLRQSDALRRRAVEEIDWDNVAEEIEDVSRSEARELLNRLVVLLAHLLKWRFQPERRGRSWELTIKAQRAALTQHLAENPGLKSRRDALLGQAYVQARLQAALETELAEETFPETNPFTWAQALDEAFWPE